MPRELTNLEVDQFLQRHPDVWDMVDANARELVYPQDGLAVLDPSGRYVLVWKDAIGIWHYIDLADMTEMQSIAESNNAPAFISDPDYLGLIQERIKDLVNTSLSIGIPTIVIVGGLIVFYLIKKG